MHNHILEQKTYFCCLYLRQIFLTRESVFLPKTYNIKIKFSYFIAKITVCHGKQSKKRDIKLRRGLLYTSEQGVEMDFQNSGGPCVDTTLQTEVDNISYSAHELNSSKSLQIKKKAFALNYVPNVVIEYNNDMTIVWANRAACKLSGLTLKQLVGNDCCQTYFDFLCNNSNCPVRGAFETGQQKTKTIRTDDDRAFSIIALPFINTSGEVDSVIEIIKDESYSDIIDSFRSGYYSEVLAFFNKLTSLTDREYEVMSLVVKGKSNKRVSQMLGISSKTVEIHRSRVMTKLGVDSLAELVRLFTLSNFYNKNIPSSLLR